MDNFKYNHLVEKMINYKGSNPRIKEVCDVFCDSLTKYGNSEIFYKDNSEFIKEGAGIVVHGKHYIGRIELKSVIRETEKHFFKLHTLPFKLSTGKDSLYVDHKEELRLTSEGVDDIKESIYFEQTDMMYGEGKDFVVMPYDKVKEFADHNNLTLQENRSPYMPTYLGGTIKENIQVLFKDDNKVIIDTIGNAYKYDELILTSGEEVHISAYDIKESVAITESGLRIAPVLSVYYNDKDLEHLVNGHELNRFEHITIREGKLGRKIAGGGKAILKAITNLKGLESKIRGAFKKLRQSKEERYKQQILNEEILPVADNVFRVFVGAVVIGGAVVLGGPLGLLFGSIIAMVLNTILKLNFDNKKEICLKLLDDQIAQAEEEINDAKSENDLSTKRALQQVHRQLVRKRDKLKYKGSLGARG